VTPRGERRHGKHPSQKPLALLERIVLLASKPGDTILDPFSGSGTLSVAAHRHGRRWLAIENNPEYQEIALRRLAEEPPPPPPRQPRRGRGSEQAPA
jgi:site-specific DNA-methyltransferase (adenine-specific)